MKKGDQRFEVFGRGRAGILDDYRRLDLVGEDGRRTVRSRFSQDKGHAKEMVAFTRAVKGASGGDAQAVPSVVSAVLATLTTIQALRSLQSGTTQIVALDLLD